MNIILPHQALADEEGIGANLCQPCQVRWREQATLGHDHAVIGDHRCKLFGRLNGALSGLMLGYYQRGSLYGATSDKAFSVNTGPSVNTLNTIAAGAINANIAVKLSQFAETVNINITKYNLTTAIPA